MTVRVRRPGEDEFEEFGRTLGLAFSEEVSAAELELARKTADPARLLAAYDGRTMIGTTGSYGFRLSVPGGEARCAGVSAVAVIPTHRRRGILTRLMREQLEGVHEREEPLAALWASEGGIYGRFGYGLATRNARIDAERDRARLGSAGAGARVRLVGTDAAMAAIPRVYDRARSATPGFPSRSRDWWEHHVLSDLEEHRRGAGPLHRAVLELDGRPEAYALYRVRSEWGEGFPASTLVVQEEISISPAATREIWRFLFGVDLVARVRNRSMPPDHPLFLLVPEPARLRFRLGDGIFVRLVDVRAALEARTYGDGSLTLDVADPLCPWNGGRWTLDGASVRRARRSPDLSLDVRALGSAYLGGFSFGELVRAGQAEEHRPGAAARADSLFRAGRAPWCPGFF